jgi:hypothetical protein
MFNLRWRLSFLLEAISVLRDKSYKISWCNYVSLSCFGQMSLGMQVIGGERASALNAPMHTSQFHRLVKHSLTVLLPRSPILVVVSQM